MSSSVKSLNAQVPIPALLKLLGCHARLQGLPLRTRCPICREGVLRIFQDHASGGGWHHCSGCGSCGDLIALAARTLKLTIPETIAHLIARGFDLPSDPAVIRQYDVEHVGYTRRLNDLWQTARDAHLCPHRDFARLTYRLGLQREEWRTQWQDSIGQLIGSLDKTSIEQAFAPRVMRAAKARAMNCSPSAYRTFPGEEWGRVVAVPFFDLPGRISSFLFIGRDADPARDFVIKRANRGSRGNQHVTPDAEAGLAFHPDVIATAESHDRTVLAVGDPLLMLRLQVRQFRRSQRPLPLVGWYDTDQWPEWYTGGRRTRTQMAWQMFAEHRVVVWAPLGLDVLTLRQAIAADAHISLAGPQLKTAEALQEYVWKKPPDQLWDHVVGKARHWSEVLSRELQAKTDAGVEAWIVQMEHEQEPLPQILTHCWPRVRERVNELITRNAAPRTIELDGKTIVEANGSWRWLRNGRPPVQILGAILRIDKVLYDRDRELGFVSGRILHDDRVIKFFEPLKRIEADPIGFIRAALMDLGVGFLGADHRFNAHLLRIATTFQQAEVLDAVSRIGWDRDGARFVLPQFTLERDGIGDVSDALIPDRAPAAALEPPSALIASDLSQPTDDAEADQLFWATAACVVRSIVAPTQQALPEGICLAGRGARSVGLAVAEALGCLRIPVRRAADVEHARDAAKTHDWPVIFDINPDLQRRPLLRLLDAYDGVPNAIVALDWHASRLLCATGEWNVISSEERLEVSARTLETAARLLPAYLRHFRAAYCDLSDHFRPATDFDPPQPLVERVLPDLADFVKQEGGDPTSVLAASEVLLTTGFESRRRAMLDLIGRLVAEGRLKVAEQPDRRGKPTLVEHPDIDVLELSHDALQTALRHVPIQLLSPFHLVQLLSSSGLLKDVPEGVLRLRRQATLRQWRTEMKRRGNLLRISG